MLKKYLCCFFALAFSIMVYAEPPVCFKQMEQQFFNRTYVTEALAMHPYIFQSTWNQINQSLELNMSQVPKNVRERASKMHPNPLEISFRYKESEKILKQVLFETLEKTLAAYAITNPNQVQNIFDYVMSKQLSKWEACFGHYIK